MFFDRNIPVVEIPLAVLYDKRLSNAQRIAYTVICRLNEARGSGNYSVRSIAQTLNTSCRTAQEHTAALREAGLIKVTYQRGTFNIFEIIDPSEVYYNEDTIDRTLRTIYVAERASD